MISDIYLDDERQVKVAGGYRNGDKNGKIEK
jgi:hypothetical protein